MSILTPIEVALHALAGPQAHSTGSAMTRALASMKASAPSIHAPGTEALAGLLAYNSGGWEERFAGRMRRVPVHVLEHNLCNACIVRAAGEVEVFVGLGLLKAIVYFEEWIHLGSHAANMLQAKAWSDEQTLHRVLYGALSPLIVFAREGNSLPRPGAALSVADRAVIYSNSAMAVQFMMMHELGHEACGHLKVDGSGAPVGPTALSLDRIEALRREELEADRYVLEALKPAWLPMAAAYCMNLMMLIGLLERHIGPSGSHPLAVARMHHLVRALGDAGEPSIAQNLTELIQFHRELWMEPEEPALGYGPTFGVEALALLQNAYRLHLAENPPADPTSKMHENATLWEEVVEQLWSTP